MLDRSKVNPEKVGDGGIVRGTVAERERPVMPDARRRPFIDPFPGVPRKVDPTRGVANLQQRAGDHDPLRSDEGK